MGEVKNWASILDEGTRRQAEMLSRAPGIAGHVALMPDAHIGYLAFGWVTTGQLLSVPMLVAGAVMLWWAGRRAHEAP